MILKASEKDFDDIMAIWLSVNIIAHDYISKELIAIQVKKSLLWFGNTVLPLVGDNG